VSSDPPPSPARSLKGLSVAVVAGLAACAVTDLAAVVHAIVDNGMWSRVIDDPRSVSAERLELGDTLRLTIGMAQGLAFLATAIVFLIWFGRGMANLALWSIPRHSRAFAIVAWFVPILNWFVPKQAANDLWRAGEPDVRHPLVLDAWWAMWVITNLISFSMFRLGEDRTPAEFRETNQHEIAAGATGVVAALLCIQVVRAITRRHAERAPLARAPEERPRLPFTRQTAWTRPEEPAS
jgi:hypothetical protein